MISGSINLIFFILSRSALVNNTIFATLAVKYDFHKYFLHFSPSLHSVVSRFVKMQAAADESKYVMDDFYLFGDLDDLDEAEDVEVPKALGDIFESIAGKNVQRLEKIVKNIRILYFLNSFLP